MRHLSILSVCAALVLILCLGGAALSPAASPAEEALQTPSLGAALAPAGQPALIEFGAGYCPPCRLMEPILKAAEKDYKGRAAVVSIDVTKYPELATKAGVRVIPTLVFYDAEGREVARHVGYMDKKTLRAQLDRLLAK